MIIAFQNKIGETENLDHIHIYKTNIRTADLQRLAELFRKQPAITSWTVDTEDCDAVLRVISARLSETKIQESVSKAGFFCEPLS